MIYIHADNENCRIQLKGDTGMIAAEYCAATETAGEQLAERIKGETDAVKFATYLMVSRAMTDVAGKFSLKLLEMIKDRRPLEITLDMGNLDEIKRQIREMENGDGE